ncbi:hypothetical protein [Streptomyces tropicalis]|uniref:Zinc-finger domain-containing protein n=1 Tax=Streptomyces tropicalis TaxID=3034234 RepID=A0ABT6A3Z2_9ACTN|nr:hypothetical protein [Streptomyces tropicalis]MDF3299193.1 hypothetical protein [Streptomyces tropicalis]
MTVEMTCARLREIGAELALGVLPGRERSGAVAHLDRCPGCREYVEQLTLVGDRLIGLLPGSEPPVGFETRVAQALMREASGHAGRRAAARRPGSRLPWPGAGRRPRLRIAAAATAAVLALGFGGWAVGTAVQGAVAGPAAPGASVVDLMEAPLMSPRAAGTPVGDIYVHRGTPGWVYMSVDLADAGTPYTGRVTCLLERGDGRTLRVGDFTVHRGYGYWGGPVSIGAAPVAGARITAADGTVLATARFPAAGPDRAAGSAAGAYGR